MSPPSIPAELVSAARAAGMIDTDVLRVFDVPEGKKAHEFVMELKAARPYMFYSSAKEMDRQTYDAAKKGLCAVQLTRNEDVHKVTGGNVMDLSEGDYKKAKAAVCRTY